MATTSAFGWETPDDTDLVKDGAAAIRTLGNSIDTSMADLKGGTSGQVLSKASNTDMDFTWVAQDDSNAIQNAIVDAKGDLIAATAADTPARLAVGANDLFLQAASGETTGMKWGGTWTSFTPTFTNITVGNGTLSGSYLKIGKMIMVRVNLTWGSTTSMSGAFSQFTLPFTADPDYEISGSTTCWDFGTAIYAGSVWMSGSTSVDLMVNNTAGTYQVISSMTGTVPFTWTTGDIFRIQMIYKAA